MKENVHITLVGLELKQFFQRAFPNLDPKSFKVRKNKCLHIYFISKPFSSFHFLLIKNELFEVHENYFAISIVRKQLKIDSLNQKSGKIKTPTKENDFYWTRACLDIVDRDLKSFFKITFPGLVKYKTTPDHDYLNIKFRWNNLDMEFDFSNENGELFDNTHYNRMNYGLITLLIKKQLEINSLLKETSNTNL